MSHGIGRRAFLRRTTAAGVLASTGLAAVERVALPTPEVPPVPPRPRPLAESLTDRQLDSRESGLAMYDEMVPRHTFAARDAAEARRWQDRTRALVIERLGGFPATRARLRPEVLETRDMGACTREKVVNTFRDSFVQLPHCPDNYVPGLLREIELYDLAGLVAPRGLFVESGGKDRISPVAGFRTAVAKARTIYDAFGAADSFGSEAHPGIHEFHGVGAFAFLARRLRARPLGTARYRPGRRRAPRIRRTASAAHSDGRRRESHLFARGGPVFVITSTAGARHGPRRSLSPVRVPCCTPSSATGRCALTTRASAG